MATVLLFDSADEVARLQYHLLHAAPDLQIEVTSDAFRAVESTARTRPDVVVVDLGLEGPTGPELVRRLCASSPTTSVVARSTARDPHRIAETLAAGAAGYVLREEGPEVVLGAVRAALGGGAEVARTVVRAMELETELDELRANVSQGTSAKADFLANISHELRTPVTVAKGIAYVLRNPNVPPAEREQFIEQLQSSLDSLMQIVDEIITIAELERGTFALEVANVDLGPLVRHAVDEVSRSYPSVPITAQVPDTFHAIADGARIGGVVRELLDNACRYSPAGHAVELLARTLDEGVVVTVTDRGEGLDRSIANQAFDQPFSTGEPTLRKERSGAGVGLHLARQIIVEHGGVMWADPLPGGGTRISFCLPIREGQRLAAPPVGVS
jgi:signal transduction histidine kinase